MSLDFGSILGRAWKITWENKILWVFGILASLGGGGGGGGSPNFDFSGGGGGGQPELPPEVERFFDRLAEEPAFLAVIIGLVCLLLLIGLAFFVLSIIGRGGLIGGISLADANGKVTFGEAWGAGTSHFWRLFLIGLLVGLIIFVLALVTLVPTAIFAGLTFGVGLLCFFPVLCVFILAAIVLGIIAYFAQIAAVIENLGVTDALRRAWEVIRANLGPIIVLGIILAVVGGILGLVIAAPLIVAVFPPVFGAITGDESGLRAGLAVAAVCFVVYLPVLLVASGILHTWITAAWTLAYKQFTRPATPPSDFQPASPAM